MEPIITEKIFSNGTKHLEARCSACENFIKYLPHETDYKEVVMPFGKHKGEKLVNINSEYLWWLLENEAVKGNLKNCIEQVFQGTKNR